MYFYMAEGIALERRRAGGRTIFNGWSPTRAWACTSMTAKRWSPIGSMNWSHVAESVGRSGVTYTPSMGHGPTLLPLL